MTCRHRPGDPDCSSSGYYQAREAENRLREQDEAHRQQMNQLRKQMEQLTPDSRNYTIERVEVIGTNIIVLQVRYPNCAKCSYEGLKTLVYDNTTLLQMVKWKEIDPHFGDLDETPAVDQAPSPIARFHGSEKGWQMALSFVRNCLMGRS